MLDNHEHTALWTPVRLPNPGEDPIFAEVLALQAKVDGLSGGAVGGGTNDAREWSKVANEAERLLSRCNHLRVAATLVSAWVHSQGWAGFVRGTHVIEQLVAHCWEHLVPALVDGEAYKRCSAVEQLEGLAPVLRQTALCGSLSLEGLRGSENEAAATAAFSATKPAARAMAAVALARLDALAAAFKAHTNEQPQLDGLRELVREADARMRALSAATGLPIGDEPAAEEAEGEGETPMEEGPAAGGNSARRAAVKASGAIETRADVLATLDRLCAYYARYEPSSPVPLLLTRARKLVNMTFLEAVQDLADQGVAQVRLLMGPQEAKPEKK